MGHSKRYWYTLIEIAGVTGIPVATVRRHVRDGQLKPENLVSVARYVVSELLKGKV